jgi:hypothetical protein
MVSEELEKGQVAKQLGLLQQPPISRGFCEVNLIGGLTAPRLIPRFQGFQGGLKNAGEGEVIGGEN